VKWDVDCIEAYDEFAQRTDPEEDSAVRLAVMVAMFDWMEFGPPEDALWSDESQSFLCDLPGGIVAEFVKRKMAVPPIVYVTKFIWHPPLN
jgi:hypothetical protein